MLVKRPRLWLMTAALFAVTGGVSVAATEASRRGLVELTLPRGAAENEAVWLQIQVGALAPGASITVSSSDGELLGSVSPYGLSRGAASSAYLVPLPKTAIVNGRVQLRIMVEEAGKPSREPRADEVENAAPVYVPVTN